jgi:GTP cyclohydrolase I
MNMENERRKVTNVETLETAKAGFANGISLQLKELLDKGEHRSLNDKEKEKIIKNASFYYGKFLTSLGVDWEQDPNSMETPTRVAKKYVLEQWKGRYNLSPEITSFPSDNYPGMVLECNIPLTSMCSHHHESILGRVHIAYIPGEDARVIGLSKLNRLVEHFGRRGAIQEQLTMAIHQAVSQVCEENIGVAVSIIAIHSCVLCRGTGHRGASMVTNHLSGVFKSKPEVRKEYFDSISMANNLKNSH